MSLPNAVKIKMIWKDWWSYAIPMVSTRNKLIKLLEILRMDSYMGMTNHCRNPSSNQWGKLNVQKKISLEGSSILLRIRSMKSISMKKFILDQMIHCKKTQKQKIINRLTISNQFNKVPQETIWKFFKFSWRKEKSLKKLCTRSLKTKTKDWWNNWRKKVKK